MLTPLPKYLGTGSFLPCKMMTHPHPVSGLMDHRFASSDSPDNFRKILKTKPKNWHYRRKEIWYDVNSAGYRTKEWEKINWAESIVIFGCSNVTGIGVAEDETISYHLSKLTNRYVVNMGIPGSSIICSLHNSILLAENFPTPWAVVFSWTIRNRITEYQPEAINHCGPWNGPKAKIFYEWNKEETNPVVHSRFAKLSSKLIWEPKTKYYDYSLYNDIAGYLDADYIDGPMLSSRDGIHPGYDATPLIAKRIFENLRG